MDVAECERQTENGTHARITANKSANADQQLPVISSSRSAAARCCRSPFN